MNHIGETINKIAEIAENIDQQQNYYKQKEIVLRQLKEVLFAKSIVYADNGSLMNNYLVSIERLANDFVVLQAMIKTLSSTFQNLIDCKRVGLQQ